MMRYLLLVVLTMPFVWTAFDDWHRDRQAAPSGGSGKSLSLSECEAALTYADKRLTDASAGRDAWSEQALRFDRPSIPSASPTWHEIHAAMSKHHHSLADAQRFADDYRAAASPDSYADDRHFQRALQARALEVVLLGLRRSSADAALLKSYRRGVQQYVADHERFSEFNAPAHAAMKSWIEVNESLSKYPSKECRTLLRKGLARLRDGEETPFAKAAVDKAAHVAGVLAVYQSIGDDDPLAERVSQVRTEWQSARQLMDRLNGRSDVSEKVRAIGELADILIRGGEVRVVEDARLAARKLCEKHLPLLQPLDPLVLIDGQPVPRAEVSIVWGDSRRDSLLSSAGPMDELCDEFCLERLRQDGKANGIDVRFKRPGETTFARRAPDKVAPTAKSLAARTYNEARRTLLESRWTADRLQRLRDRCGPRDDCPALGELERTLDAILSHPKAFFP